MPKPTASTIQVLNIFAISKMGIEMIDRDYDKIKINCNLFYPEHPKYKGLVLAILKNNPRKGVYNKRISEILPEYNYIAGDVYLFIDEDLTDSGYNTFNLCEDVHDDLEVKQKEAKQTEKDFNENISNCIY